MCLGELLGPITAGFLTKKWGFARGCSLTAMGILLIGLLYIPVLFVNTKNDKSRKSSLL
jgi:hypothetical protein